MHSLDDDPYQLTDSLSINALLQTLLKKKLLIRMQMEDYPEAVISTLLDVQTTDNQITIDASADEHHNLRLTQAQAIHFDAILDKVSVQFSTGGAKRTTFKNHQALSIPFPDYIRRLQRRDHFRVDTLVSMPLYCEIPISNSKTVRLAVKDISAGGLALLDPEQLISASNHFLEQCLLELDGIGNLIVNLGVRRISEYTEPGSPPVRIVACQFENQMANSTVMLQNYINRLERLLNARRQGFE